MVLDDIVAANLADAPARKIESSCDLVYPRSMPAEFMVEEGGPGPPILIQFDR
jgi:hypothetical protein